MIIKVDKEGKDFLTNLADIALKGVGVQAMQIVGLLGKYMSDYEENPPAKDENLTEDSKDK